MLGRSREEQGRQRSLRAGRARMQGGYGGGTEARAQWIWMEEEAEEETMRLAQRCFG